MTLGRFSGLLVLHRFIPAIECMKLQTNEITSNTIQRRPGSCVPNHEEILKISQGKCSPLIVGRFCGFLVLLNHLLVLR